MPPSIKVPLLPGHLEHNFYYLETNMSGAISFRD